MAEARRQERDVLSALKATPPKLEEYDKLMWQLDSLHGVIGQLNRQIAGSGAGA